MTSPPSPPRIARSTDHVETRHGDRIMAMSLKRGEYFAIEATGARIWDLLEKPRTEDELADALTAEYDVPRERCLRDLRAFLADLDAHGLIRTVDPQEGAQTIDKDPVA